MKKSILFSFIILISFNLSLFSQVNEENRAMSAGSKNALVTTINEVDEKFAEKQWKDYSKEFKGKSKKIGKYNLSFIDDASIAGIGGANSVDVYAQFKEKGQDTEFILWIDMGGAYLNSKDHPREYAKAESLVERFALETATAKTEEVLKDQEKTLKDLEKNLEKLEKDNANYHADIEQAEELIRTRKADIEKNVQDQKDAKKMVEEQKKMVENVKDKLKGLKK